MNSCALTSQFSLLVVLAEWFLTKLENPSFLQNKTPSNFLKSSSDTGQICIVNIYGPIMVSLCAVCVKSVSENIGPNSPKIIW